MRIFYNRVKISLILLGVKDFVGFLQNDAAVKPWALKALEHVCVSLSAGTPGTYLWCVALYVVRLPEPRVCDVMGRTSPSVVPVVKDQPFQAVCEDIQPVGEAGQQYFMVQSIQS